MLDAVSSSHAAPQRRRAQFPARLASSSSEPPRASPVFTEPRLGERTAMKRSHRRLSAASRRRPRRSHCHRLIRRKWSCARPKGIGRGGREKLAAGEPKRGWALGQERNLDPHGPPSRKWKLEEESTGFAGDKFLKILDADS